MPSRDQLRDEQKRAWRRALGQVVARKRWLARLTQAQLASVLGWSRPTLTQVELGNQATTVDQIYELAHVLCCNAEDFLGWHPDVEEVKAAQGLAADVVEAQPAAPELQAATLFDGVVRSRAEGLKEINITRKASSAEPGREPSEPAAAETTPPAECANCGRELDHYDGFPGTVEVCSDCQAAADRAAELNAEADAPPIAEAPPATPRPKAAKKKQKKAKPARTATKPTPAKARAAKGRPAKKPKKGRSKGRP